MYIKRSITPIVYELLKDFKIVSINGPRQSGKTRLNESGNIHKPREWFIAPLEVIEEAVELIISGKIVDYRYDEINEKISLR